MRRLFILSVVAFTLHGCSIFQPESADRAEQYERIEGLEEWRFKGRMAVKVEDDPDASGQLNIQWHQISEESRIRLSGPFGAGAWELLWQPERVSISDSGDERSIEYTGPDAALEFMRAELGWSFPAEGIRYWVRGLPDPAVRSAMMLGEDDRLSGLQQYGWNIAYERYELFDGLAMPTRIRIEGRGVRLRMIISKWQFDG